MSCMRTARHPPPAVPEETSAWKANTLPALLRQRDLALLAILVMVIAPQIRALQFAGGAVFFYVFLAFVTLQLPSMAVFRWLARQAPARVPIYLWMLRLVDERWRSMLLFLSWWSGVLIILPAIGISFDLLQIYASFWFSRGLVQGAVFVGFLALATLSVSLPLRLFRMILWMCGLCYLAYFALVGVAAVVFLLHLQSTGGTFPHPTLTMLPRHFSWSLFGLAVLNMIGVNAPLFLDGEMRGTRRFLRHSTRYLWWAGLGVLLILLTSLIFWVTVDPTLHIFPYPAIRYIRLLFGSDAAMVAWVLISLGSFGSALAFVFLFSRAFLLAARQHYLPHVLARANRWGVPTRAILIQSLLILGLAVFLLMVAPALLRTFLPGPLVTDVTTGDWFGLFAAIAGSLWSLLTALLFLFALWLFWKKGGLRRGKRGIRLVFPALCLSGCTSVLVCAFAPFLPDWPVLFFSHTHWLPMIVIGLVCSLAASWVIGELPRRGALVRAKAESLTREKALREGLQQSYTREHALHHQLQGAYDEQQILMLRQKVLLDEVSRLYQEQKQMAMTDQVTQLLNHRTFLERLEEAITRCHQDGGSFLLVFLDLDHFKAINDT